MNTDIRILNTDDERSREMEAITIEEEVMTGDSVWRKVTRWSLYAIAFLAPLLFLPYTTPPTLIKEVVVSALAIIAFITWLGETLLEGRVYYKRTLINAGSLILLLVLFSSTLVSSGQLTGLLASDILGERFISFLVFALIVFITGSTLTKKDESTYMMGWFLMGGFLLSLLSLSQLLAPSLIPLSFLARPDVNPIGTTNAVAVLMGFFFILALGLLTSASRGWFSRWSQICLYIILCTSFANLLLINFRIAWIGVMVSLIILLGFKVGLPRVSTKSRMFMERDKFALLFLALAIVTFFILSGTSLIRLASIPNEVSPSYQATLNIARQVLKAHPLLGSGPGTFGIDYSLYRDPSINQTNFWGVRFNSGAAFMPTILATTGILGVLAFALFSLFVLISLFRQVTRERSGDPVLLGGSAAVVFALLMWWLYNSTFAFQVALFALIGILISRMNESLEEGETQSWWRISERFLGFTAPWTTFVVSLITIFLMVGSVAFLYYSMQEYIAAVYFNQGVDRFSNKGDIPGAIDKINRAAGLDSQNDQYYRTFAQVLLGEVQAIVNQASKTQNANLQNDFQSAVTNAITAAERATQINSVDALNWSTLAFVYQSIVPFIQGSENLAIQSYDKAIQNDPLNPSYEFSKGSTYIALADRDQLLANQAGQSREAIDALAKGGVDALANARASLEKSIQLKSDYPQANYLLAQVLLREGNLPRAIQQVEAVRQLAPFDIGVAFQLGVLYYQSNDLVKAQAEFERAVSLNDKYSNARYFLGLIYDRNGQKDRALSEFKAIASLNPDNQEVKTIIANLEAGKPALATISPPAPSPTERKEPPVKDSGQPRL